MILAPSAEPIDSAAVFVRRGLASDTDLALLAERTGGSLEMGLALRSDGAATCRCGEAHPTVFLGTRPTDAALPGPTQAALRALPRGCGVAAHRASALLADTTLMLPGSPGLRITGPADLGAAEGEVALVHFEDLARLVAHHPAPERLRLATAAGGSLDRGVEPAGWERTSAATSLRRLVELLGGRLERLAAEGRA